MLFAFHCTKMSASLKLKQTFDVISKYGAFYTGGNVEWLNNNLFCQTNSVINVVDIETGSVTSTIGDDAENNIDNIQTFTKNDENVVTSHKSGLLKLWNHKGQLVKQWKYIHKGPIAKLQLGNNILISGGSDSTIRCWDLEHQVCLFCLKGLEGVVSIVEFHPVERWIFGSGDNGNINMWEIEKGKLLKVFSGHYSKVTSLCFHHDNKHFITSSRDKVLILWNIENQSAIKTVPVYEVIESVVSLPKKIELPHISIAHDSIHIATAGNKGVIRIWDIANCKEIYVQGNSLINKCNTEGGLAITKLLFNVELEAFAVLSQEHTIVIHDLKTFKCVKQFVGFSDEILDAVYVGKDDSYLAVATNSADIKLYEDSTMNCKLLKGHTDIVLALSKCPDKPILMLSSSKDNSIRLWLMDEGNVQCVGIGLRHTGSVGSVAFGQSSFLVSVSQDMCIKKWELPSKFKENCNLYCSRTQIAHDKDINTVSVSPNNKMIATGSQDKTLKLWSEDLQLLGVLRGHKRSVWCVRFSPVDQVVLSSSADTTIKLWSVENLNCLKTFQSHEASVLRIEFITNGMQFLSTGGDGLVKLFNVKTSDCVLTVSEHEGRIWSLALKKDESQFVTGGSDSLLVKWRDVTEEKIRQRLEEHEEYILQEQQLSNYLQGDQFLKALKLALSLNKPLHVLKIVQNIIKKGEFGLNDTIAELRNDQKEQLLKIAANWNTNSKYCQPAQVVLNVLLSELQSGKFRPSGLSNTLEGLLPYTERHFKRATQLLQDIYFITYTMNCMQPHLRIN